jgi:phosphoserine phosphatase RsbU/P
MSEHDPSSFKFPVSSIKSPPSFKFQVSSFEHQVSSFKYPILIAEDDVTSRTLLRAVLRKGGHEVVAACDGEEAWDVLQRPDTPRLAILDWMMPGLDGVGVVRRVRAVDTDRPPYIIMLTTRNEKNDIIEGLRAGADDYLIKPWDAEELHARIEVGCRMISLQDRLADKVRELQEALDQVKTLEGILPICSFCKKIRDDGNYWQQVEEYVGSHSGAKFSHSICPQCMSKHYPEFAESIAEQRKENPT